MLKIFSRHHTGHQSSNAPASFALLNPSGVRSALRGCLLAAVLLFAAGPVQSQWINNQPAVSVIGQPNLTSSINAVSPITATGMSFPVGVTIDPTTGKVFVADANICRVTRYSSMAAMLNGQPAEAALGVPDLMSTGPGIGPNGMLDIRGIFVDGAGRLWVPDRVNHRVLRFDNASTKATGANADGVLGQPDFTSRTMGLGPGMMQFPQGVTVDGAGRLWVADRGNNRVLRFDNAAAKPNGAAADAVLGQPDLMSSGAAASPTGMNLPENMITDAAGRLWVSDSGNNRVLRFDNAAAKPNGGAADGVLGQPDLMSGGAGTSQSRMNEPSGLALDPAGRLYVVEVLNHRVLIFDNVLTKGNGANADNVLGQPDFISGGANNGGVSATSFNLPFSAAFDPVTNSLYVTEASNRRVKRYVGCSSIAFTTASLPVGDAGGFYSQTLTVTPPGSYTFSLATGSLPAGMTLDPSTGVLSGVPSVTGTYTFTVNALAASGCSATQVYSLVINCPTVSLSPASLPGGTTGTAYSQAISASPAGGGYTYSVTSGALPTGLSLNVATGGLIGTLTASGSFTFTITATGFGGCTGSQSYTVVVGGGCGAVTLPPSLPNGKVGVLYNAAAVASPAGLYSYAPTAGSVPPGVTLYSFNGLLFGYPTMAGTYTFTVAATQGTCTVSQMYTVVIAP